MTDRVKAAASIVQAHPNTLAASRSTIAGAVVVYVAHRCGYSLSTYWALGVVGMLAPIRLFIGKRGVFGAALELRERFKWGSDGKP